MTARTSHWTALRCPPDGLGADAVAKAPRAPGLLDLRAASGDTLAVWVTGDLRALLARRAARDPEPCEPPDANASDDTTTDATESVGSPRADLRPVTAQVRWCATGSVLEAEAGALHLARERLPDLFDEMCARSDPAWLVFDTQPSPRWRVGTLGDAALATTPDERLIGPYSSPAAARAVAQLADEAAELCRYPAELAKAPGGTPCAYKDMGRCPGACDGAESMPDYLDRFHAASDALVSSANNTGHSELGVMHERVRTAIDAAASATDYERAATLKARLDALDAFTAEAASVGTLSGFTALGLFACARKGWVRVVRCLAGELDAVLSLRLPGPGSPDDADLEDRWDRLPGLATVRTDGSAPDSDPRARRARAAVVALVMRELARTEPVRARGVWLGPLGLLSDADRRSALRRARRVFERAAATGSALDPAPDPASGGV